jgi:replicative DNA helicase
VSVTSDNSNNEVPDGIPANPPESSEYNPIPPEEVNLTTPAEMMSTPAKKGIRGRGRKSHTASSRSDTNGIQPPQRQIPCSIEAEQGVLGCIMLAPKENLDLLVSKLNGKDNLENIFYDVRHQTLISQILAMNDEHVPIDDLTLIQRLNDRGLLDAAGGIAYVSSLKDAPPSPLNMEYYLDIVREKYLLRSLVQTCTVLAEDVYSDPSDVEVLLDKAEKEILRINGEWVHASSSTMKELVKNAFTTIQNYVMRKGELTGLATGFPQLDKMTSGLHEGEMVVIAARPSMGKTSLAMNIAEHAAIELNQPVGVFSLEMTAESLVMRMLCSRAQVSMQSIRNGTLTNQDFMHMTNEASKLASAPVYIDDTPGLSILNLRSRARRMMEKGIKLFVIDYLQLLHSSVNQKGDNRQQEIADISNNIKSLAKELKVPVIVLSQLNRDVEKEKNRQPRLSDLRESGAIEQDADIVLLIYRPNNKAEDHYSKDEDEEQNTQNKETTVPIKLIIAKQRNGPTGDVDLIFLKNYTRFVNPTRVRPEDVQ